MYIRRLRPQDMLRFAALRGRAPITEALSPAATFVRETGCDLDALSERFAPGTTVVLAAHSASDALVAVALVAYDRAASERIIAVLWSRAGEAGAEAADALVSQIVTMARRVGRTELDLRIVEDEPEPVEEHLASRFQVDRPSASDGSGPELVRRLA